jgi:hypothetical protein
VAAAARVERCRLLFELPRLELNVLRRGVQLVNLLACQ